MPPLRTLTLEAKTQLGKMSAEEIAKIVTRQDTPSSIPQWFVFLLDKYGPWAFITAAAFWFYSDIREDKQKLLEAYRESSAAMHNFSKSVDALSYAVKESIDNTSKRSTN